VKPRSRDPILSVSLGGIPVAYNIGGRQISGRGPHFSEVGCVSSHKSQSLAGASPTTMPTCLFFKSYGYKDLPSAFLSGSKPRNISHAYQGKSQHILS
jgi:hypothetical protein